jgi:hypothetical protein
MTGGPGQQEYQVSPAAGEHKGQHAAAAGHSVQDAASMYIVIQPLNRVHEL